MACCPPSCAIPSCASCPVIGLGPPGCGSSGYRGFGQGYGYGSSGLAEYSSNLGTLAGIRPSCINQIPSSEVVIQPPATVITVPGPIMSASCDPICVGGYTPCATEGYGRYGGYRGGRQGRLGRRGSICSLPCYSPC
ncbi:feather keratin-like [Candoia aspera]|uniref:feather keratin-like n=1 Tax=Candoia aspera TaxID=51853 RepID=UPI002FD8559B